jgi:hypothetical protein
MRIRCLLDRHRVAPDLFRDLYICTDCRAEFTGSVVYSVGPWHHLAGAGRSRQIG